VLAGGGCQSREHPAHEGLEVLGLVVGGHDQPGGGPLGAGARRGGGLGPALIERPVAAAEEAERRGRGDRGGLGRQCRYAGGADQQLEHRGGEHCRGHADREEAGGLLTDRTVPACEGPAPVEGEVARDRDREGHQGGGQVVGAQRHRQREHAEVDREPRGPDRGEPQKLCRLRCLHRHDSSVPRLGGTHNRPKGSTSHPQVRPNPTLGGGAPL
jgi:hypothetical protein